MLKKLLALLGATIVTVGALQAAGDKDIYVPGQEARQGSYITAGKKAKGERKGKDGISSHKAKHFATSEEAEKEADRLNANAIKHHGANRKFEYVVASAQDNNGKTYYYAKRHKLSGTKLVGAREVETLRTV